MLHSIFRRITFLLTMVTLTAVSHGALVQQYDASQKADFLVALNSANAYSTGFEGLVVGSQSAAAIYGNASFSSTIFGVATVTSPSTPSPAGNDAFVVTVAAHPAGQQKAVSTVIDQTFLRLDFSASPTSVTAVGGDFFATTGSEALVTDTVTARITFFDDTFSTITFVSPTAGEFAGFTTDTPIKWLQIGVAVPAQYATIDNIYIGEVTPVPEPSFTGIAAALLCVFVAGRGTIKRAWAKLPRRAS